MTPLDCVRLREALVLAEHAIGLSDPNPRVGCVIGREDGSVLGRGFTQQAGGPHAEVMALRDAAGHGASLRGATAWVTLEPCAHHGRTPPCCDALVAAGIGRVVAAVEDPFHGVSGRGFDRLRTNGVQVTLAEGEVAAAALELNIGFFSRMLRHRPWVRVKAACSLDGRTALPSGESQWITGPEARADGHAWRRRASVVLTGIGTVLADDPQLNVRHVPTTIQPRCAVLDSTLRLPPRARLRQAPGLIVYTHTPDEVEAATLQEGGARVVRLPAAPGGGVDLHAVLADLARREVNELHVEAGERLSGAWIEAGLTDELLVYLAPSLLGDGPAMARLKPPNTVDEAMRFNFTDIARLGPDMRLQLRCPESQPSCWRGSNPGTIEN